MIGLFDLREKEGNFANGASRSLRIVLNDCSIASLSFAVVNIQIFGSMARVSMIEKKEQCNAVEVLLWGKKQTCRLSGINMN